MPNETRRPLSAGANARNHGVTGVATAIIGGWLAANTTILDETTAMIAAGALIGFVLGGFGSVARSYKGAGGQGLGTAIGKRLAQWVG